MNYLAHGYRFVDEPMYAAGTAVPDWLSVADRKTRIRSRTVHAVLQDLNPEAKLLANGMLQHLADDDRFHRSPTFLMLESEIGQRFRRLMPDAYDHRPGFLGHILTELLLDAVLVERQPELLRRYYGALEHIEPADVQKIVNTVAARPAENLSVFISQFCRVKFLYDYLDDRLLLSRLNQVLRRVKLLMMDEQVLPVLCDARVLLRHHADELLRAVEQS